MTSAIVESVDRSAEGRVEHCQRFLLNVVPETGLMCYYTQKAYTDSAKTVCVCILKDMVLMQLSPKFLGQINDEALMFTLTHEMMHLYSLHCNRGVDEARFGNVERNRQLICAQEMVVNYLAKTMLTHHKVALDHCKEFFDHLDILPSDYVGPITIEAVYTWLHDHPEHMQKESYQLGQLLILDMSGKDDGDSDGNSEKTSDQSSASDGEKMAKLVDAIEKAAKESGNHGTDIRAVAKVCSRSGIDGSFLQSVRQERQATNIEVLYRIKRFMQGRNREESYHRLHRHYSVYEDMQIVKQGFIPKFSDLFIILDISGSQLGIAQKCLSILYDPALYYTVIQVDDQVQKVDIAKGRKLLDVPILNGGGTDLQPAIDYIVTLRKPRPMVTIMTDGYCPALRLEKLRGRIFILSTSILAPIASGKAEQVIIRL